MLISLTAPSAGGKSYVKEAVFNRYPFVTEIAWLTTRALRPTELVGGNREHVSPEAFTALEARGELMLAQEVYGYRYGVRRKDLSASAADMKMVRLTEFHIDNLLRARAQGIECVSIAILPADTALLEQHLRCRGTETEEEIALRLREARREIDLIVQHRNSFALVIELTEKTASLVCQQVYSFLESHCAFPPS